MRDPSRLTAMGMFTPCGVALRLPTDKDVLRHRQVGEERRMLMHDRDAPALRLADAAQRDFAAVAQDREVLQHVLELDRRLPVAAQPP